MPRFKALVTKKNQIFFQVSLKRYNDVYDSQCIPYPRCECIKTSKAIYEEKYIFFSNIEFTNNEWQILKRNYERVTLYTMRRIFHHNFSIKDRKALYFTINRIY